jgi:hypothetical protein
MSLGGDAVIDPRSSIYGFLFGPKDALLLQRVQNGINDAFSKNDLFFRGLPYGSNQLIAVHFLLRQKAKHKQLGNAAHEWRIWFWHDIIRIPSYTGHYT